LRAIGLAEVAAETLAGIRARGTYRRMRVLEGAQAPRMRVDGRDVLLFAGSNYLDLARHPEVVEAAARAARDLGCAAGGSRLISGNLAVHEALEADLAKFFEAEAALAFNSGYAANLGVIPALVGKGDAVVSDALSHASIVDGCRLSRAEVLVFPHGDLAALDAALQAACRDHRRVLLAIDGVYSMDGDVAPVAEMAVLARRHGAIVLLDDAHGTGTLGVYGRGSAEHCGVRDGVDVLLGTLGKGLGSYGAFVIGTAALRELLVNVARSFIFSCALAPPQVAAAHAALDLVRREPWRRERLQANAARLRERLAARGVDTHPSTTHIVPVVVGASEATMAACERLLERGFYAQGIRHPSVPEGTARLRLTPMATHGEDEIDALAEAVADEVWRVR
jgi:glycine C-acetyltransferase